MKKITFKTILSLIAVFLFSANVNAQMPEAITISPENGTAYDEITLTFNANLSCTPDGKQDLLGLQEVYMHSAAFELGQPAGWGNYSVQFDETGANGQYPILSANGDNTYSITYIPYEFYGFPEGTVITKITAVFNDGSWAAEGKDFLGEDCCDFNIPLNYIPDEPFVTFNCNMTKMINEGYFNPLNNSLYVEIYDFGVIEMLDLNANGIYNTAVDEGLVVNQEYIYQFRIDDATYEDIQRNFTAILGAITIDVWWNDDPIIPSFYTIATLTNPFEGGTTYGDGTFEGGTENTVLAMPNTNYNFIDWTVGGIQVSIDEEYTFILENDITLVANFQLIFGTQNYDLEFGFQFISSRLISENPDMLIVIEEILNNNLDFVRNSLGQTLRKIGPIWVNGIGDWIVDEGYLVKMFAADSFSIEGTLIDPATPIPVEAGFQFVSYFPENPMDALIAFETIIGDELDFIRNTQGQTLRKIGPIWVNGIGDCSPGDGYLVKMYADGEIIYPATAKTSGKTIYVSTHFAFDGGNAADPVYSIYLGGFNIGDEVAAFDGNKMIGAVKINSKNDFENELPVFSTTNSGTGYKIGNPLVLKVWNKNENVEYILSDYTFSNPYGEAWMEEVFPAEDGEYSLLHFSNTGISDEMDQYISIYPNPSDGIFNISIEGVSGKVQIKVFDVHGNDYSFFEIEGTGNLTEKLDLKELAAGVCFLSFGSKDFNQIRKIVIQ